MYGRPSQCLALRRRSLPQESSLGLTSSGCQEQWPLKVWSLCPFFFLNCTEVGCFLCLWGKERDIPKLFFFFCSNSTHPGTCPRVFFWGMPTTGNAEGIVGRWRVVVGRWRGGSATAIRCCDVCIQANNLGVVFQSCFSLSLFLSLSLSSLTADAASWLSLAKALQTSRSSY